jgi:hypothetical protein
MMNTHHYFDVGNAGNAGNAVLERQKIFKIHFWKKSISLKVRYQRYQRYGKQTPLAGGVTFVGKQPATDSDQRNAVGASRAPWHSGSMRCQYHALSLKIIHCRSLSMSPDPHWQGFHAGVEWCLPSRPPTRMTLL